MIIVKVKKCNWVQEAIKLKEHLNKEMLMQSAVQLPGRVNCRKYQCMLDLFHNFPKCPLLPTVSHRLLQVLAVTYYSCSVCLAVTTAHPWGEISCLFPCWRKFLLYVTHVKSLQFPGTLPFPLVLSSLEKVCFTHFTITWSSECFSLKGRQSSWH